MLRRPILLAILGALFCVLAWHQLWNVPRGLSEFAYDNPLGGPYADFWPLPFASINGFTPEQLHSHLVRLLLLLPGVLLLAAAWPAPSLAPWAERMGRVRWPAWGALVSLFMALGVLRGMPTLDDEATYVMQAALWLQGDPLGPWTPGNPRWTENFTVFLERGVTGKYPPGQALLLVPGVLSGFPALLQPAFVLVFLALFRAQLARLENARTATLAVALLALSPNITFVGATCLSNLPALALLAAVVHFHTLANTRASAWAGVMLGLLVVLRPQAALPAGVVVAVMSGRSWARLVALGVGALPGTLALLAYNHHVTGNPLTMPFGAGGNETYGFGPVGASQYQHTPWKALALQGVVALRLNGWALGWPASWLGVVAWWNEGRPQGEAARTWGWLALATTVFHAGFFNNSTTETGPLYHLPVVVWLAVVTARALDATVARAPSAAVLRVALLSTLLGTTSFVAEHAARLLRLTDVVASPIMALRDLPRPALVFVETLSAGHRPSGFVRGVPWRTRLPTDELVVYPRPSAATAAALQARWSARACVYVYDAGEPTGPRVVPCAEMGPHVVEVERREREHQSPWPLGPPGVGPDRWAWFRSLW